MLDNEFEDFVRLAKTEKSCHRLHPHAQKQLEMYLSRLYPRDCAVPEVSGVLGGRNDLMFFFRDGRRVAFEFFFSPSQVPQDLRLLEHAKADVKIAILLDRKVKPKLADEYLRKKPDHFPYLWLSDLMIPSQEADCLAQLRKYIDGDANHDLFMNIPLQPNSGMQARGMYEIAGKLTKASVTKEKMKMIKKIQSNSNGSTPVSFSFGPIGHSTSDEETGEIIVQY